MDNLADSLADYNDIEQAMDEGRRDIVPGEADEKELEQELEALVASEVAPEQESLETRLPSVPVSADDLATQITGLTMHDKELSRKEDMRKIELEPEM